MVVAVTPSAVLGFDSVRDHGRRPAGLLFRIPREQLTSQVHQRVNVRVLELVDDRPAPRRARGLARPDPPHRRRAQGAAADRAARWAAGAPRRTLWTVPRIPTSRLARTAKFGGLVAGQGARWAGTRGQPRAHRRAGRRGPRRAGAARRRRARRAARADEGRGDEDRPGPLDRRLRPGPRGRARGVQGAPRGAARRRPAGAVQGMRKVVERGPRRAARRPLRRLRRERRSPRRRSARSTAPRRTTARDVAVKVQYPGVAEAVETDLRNASCCSRSSSAWRPGSTPRRSRAELRERIGEELDYEIEAQNQRRVARAFRGHPFILRPRRRHRAVDAPRARHRVRRGPRLRRRQAARPRRERDRFAEICFRFFYGLLSRERARRRRPAPGQLPAAPTTAASASWTSASCAGSTPTTSRASARWPRAVIAGDADGVHRCLAELGYLPDPDAFDPERVLDAAARPPASGTSRPASAASTPSTCATSMESSSSPRSPYFD